MPPIEGRASRTQKRRQEIIDTAADVFYEKGYDASSIQDIADAVGILKGSLYYYVDSKEQFLYEIVKEAHDRGMEILEEIRAAEGDVVARITLLIHLHVQYFAANLVKVNVFYRDFQALSAAKRKDIDRLGHLYRRCIQDLVVEGQRDGSVSTAIDAAMAGVMLVEMLNSMARWFHAEGRATAEQIADQAATLLLGGAITPEARKKLGGEAAFRAGLVTAKPGKRHARSTRTATTPRTRR